MAGEFDELGFLSKAALALAEMGPEDDLFRFVAEQLALVAPDSLIITAAYEPHARSVVIRAMVGPEDMQNAARAVTGEPVGKVFPMDEQARQLLADGGLLRLEGGLHQLTFRTWPVELARNLEAELGVRSVHGQPFFRKGDYVGAVSIVSRAPSLEHARVIEVFVRLAAVAIQRQRTEAQLRESERRFRTLAENSQDVIFRLRLRPTVAFEYVSPATLHLCGRTPEEIYEEARLGAPCLYPEEWRSAPPLRELPSPPLVASFRGENGATLWTEQNFTPVRDASGDIVAVDGVVRDITKHKEVEQTLTEADRRKTEFLAMLSHELRNPLGAIRNAIYVLGRAAGGGEQASRAHAMIERQISQLTRLVDDLLDVTRITRGKFRLQHERLELNELVRAAAEDHRAMFASAKVDFEMRAAPADILLYADRTRVRQVIDNLLQNAERFTPADGRASISVSTDTERKQAVLYVHNTGPPISPEVLARVWEPFVQGDRTLERSKGGLGLGLALVKAIIEMHAGTVSVESDEAHGTTFTMRLPLQPTLQATGSPEQPSQAPQAEHRRVLVIEDNVDAAESLRDALELDLNTVAVAGTGREGIEKARAFKPDVVLCDIGLPEMDGYAVARAMRADPELKKASLVALSGYASPEDVARARDAGFDRHVSKPPSIEALERVMRELSH